VTRSLRATTVGRADIFEETEPETVLRAAGRGEHWALAQLFRTYQPRLIRYLRGQEPTVADDLAGEVWIAVARGLDGFVGDERGFRAWLFTIARSRLVDHRRKAVRRRTDPFPHDRLDRPDRHVDGGDPAATVLRRMGAQEAVDELVAELTAEQAEAVLLRVVAGLDVGEVAHVMGRSPGSVRVLCHRALRRMADRFPERVPER
jgi:RNA polymerase sigma-70 factor, ECF subfamily